MAPGLTCNETKFDVKMSAPRNASAEWELSCKLQENVLLVQLDQLLHTALLSSKRMYVCMCMCVMLPKLPFGPQID